MKSLLSLIIFLISLSCFATDFTSDDKKGFWITPNDVSQNQVLLKNGDDFTFGGTICVVRWGGALKEKGNGKNNKSNQCLKVPTSQLAFKAYFPDSLHDVSDKLVITQSNDKKSWVYSYKTDKIKNTDLNQFTLTIGTADNKKSAQLLAIKAKLEKRILILQGFQEEYVGNDTYKENLAFINKLISYLQGLVVKINSALDSSPDIIAQLRQPLQVDNITSAPFYYSSNFSGYKLNLNVPIGIAFQGEKSSPEISMTNISNRSFYFPDTTDDQTDDGNDEGTMPDGKLIYRLSLSIDGKSLIFTDPFDLGYGETKKISVQTGTLNPSAINQLKVILERSSSGKFDMISAFNRTLGTLFYNLPVIQDTVAPVFSNLKPVADTYTNVNPQFAATLADSFGRVNPQSLKVSMNGQDVTSSFAATTATLGASYVFTATIPNLAEGDYALNFSGKDFAGNSATAVLQTIHYDKTSPVILSSNTGNIFTNQNQYHLAFTILDKSSISYTILQNGKVLAQGNNISFDGMITLEEGINNIEIQAVDKAGNAATPVKLSGIELDDIPPSLTTLPDDNSIFNDIKIQVSGTSNEALQSVSVNGINLTLASNKKDFSGTINLQTEGDHQLIFNAYDMAGNLATVTKNVKVVLAVFNRNLISIEPTSNGSQLLIKGAPSAVRPGLEVNASAGFFNSKSVVANDDGSFNIILNPFSKVTVSAIDDSISRSESFDLTYTVDTTLAGIIKDVDGVPLPGVTVTIKGSTQTATTGNDGTFKISNPVTGDQKLLIDGTTVSSQVFNGQKKFSSVVYSISIGVTQPNVIEKPIYLAPIYQDGTETKIVNGSGTVVTSIHAPGVELDIPSNTVTFPDGTMNGSISIQTVQSDRTTVEPPSFAKPGTVYALEPSGTKFSKPVPLTLPNTNEFPSGMNLVIISKNSVTGSWEIDGVAKVSDDGNEIVTKDGMGITHFSEVYAAPLGPVVTEMGAGDLPGANTFSGAYTASIKMPSYKSLGQDVVPELLYQSSWAHPNAIVKNVFDIPRQDISKSTNGRIQTSDVVIDYQNDLKTWIEPEYIEAQFYTTGIIGNKIKYTGVPRKAVISYGMDLSSLKSGVHPYFASYGIQLKDMYITTQKIQATAIGDAQFENGSKTLIQTKVLADEILRDIYSTDLRAPMYIQNKKNSEAGAGWKIKGPQKLVNPNDNRIMIENSDGSISTYTIENKIKTLLKDSTGLKSVEFNAWPTISTLDSKNNIKKIDMSVATSNLITSGNVIGGVQPFSGKMVSSHGYMYNFGFNPNVGQTYTVECNYKTFPYSEQRPVTSMVMAQNGGYYALNSLGEMFFNNGNVTTHLIGLSDPSLLKLQTLSTESGFTHQTTLDYCQNTTGFACSSPTELNQNKIVQVAGFFSGCKASNLIPKASSGEYYYSGFADGNFSNSGLNTPSSMVYNSSRGSFIIADYGNHRIREANLSTNTISTIAGNGKTVKDGDGGLAINAGIFHPRAVAYDSNGNLYISTDDGYIRKIDNTGVISTFAGLPLSLGGSLEEVTTSDKVALSNPYGMVVDNTRGYLYVADTGNRRVVRINLANKISQVIAGNGSCALDSSTSDDKPALEASLCTPTQVGLDSDGNLLILDTDQNAIRRVIFTSSSAGQLSYSPTQKDGSSLYKNLDGSFTLLFRSGVISTFDRNGNQTATIDRGGRKILFSYDQNNRLLSQTDPTGAMIQYTYSGSYLSSITDPNGRVTSFYYSSGDLVEVVYPDNTSRNFEYDDHHQMIEQKDNEGNKTTAEYNSYFRLKKVTDALGNPTVFDDSDSRNAGNVLDDGSIGFIQRVGDDNANLEDKVSDANGNKTTYEKDENGYIEKIITADGKVTQSIRNDDGQLIKIIKPDLTFRTFTYNPKGDLISEYDSSTKITVSKEYDENGNIKTFTSPQGIKFTNSYSSEGLLIGSESSDGDHISQSYNSSGLLSQVTNSENQKVNYEYDNYGNLSKQINNAGDVVSYVRDGAGNIIQKIDANGSKTVYQYDIMNRLISVTSPKSEVTSIKYNSIGSIIKTVDPKGNVYNFEYDANGRVISRTDTNGLVVKMQYDGNGNLVKLIDEGGREKTFQYNSRNKIVQSNLVDNIYNFTYDDVGNVLSISNSNSKINYTYTEASQIRTVTSTGLGANSDLPVVNLSYDYDNFGNKIEMNDPTGTNSYDYDDENKLISVTNTKNEKFNFGYNQNDKLVSISRPGSNTTIAYDQADFLKSISHTTSAGDLSFYDYERDPAGNRLIKRTPAGESVYAYDPNNQILSASNSELTGIFNQENFSYDELGNRTDNGSQYDSQKIYLKEDYKFVYTFDVYGNLTSKVEKPVSNGNVTNYSYNSENLLIGIDIYANNVLTKEVKYSYDALGRRVKKQITDHQQASNDKIRKYAYDGIELLLEYNANNDVVVKYTNSTKGIDDVLSMSVTTAGVNEGIASSSGSYFFLKDSSGSITDVTNSSGLILQKYVYSAFGKVVKIKNGLNQDITNLPAIEPFKSFTGREYDSESGLYFYRARYYNPEIGRFIQSDPHPGEINNPLTYINKYIYALNNPVNSTDPLGLFSLKKFFGGVVNFVKKVVSNKYVGLTISVVTGGVLGGTGYINMSGKFSQKDITLVNMAWVAAAAVATGGAAGSAVGSMVATAAGTATGGVVGAIAGAMAGAVAGGLAGGFVDGTLTMMSGGSFTNGVAEGFVKGMIAGALAGAIAGYSAHGMFGDLMADAEFIENSDPYSCGVKSLFMFGSMLIKGKLPSFESVDENGYPVKLNKCTVQGVGSTCVYDCQSVSAGG